MRKITRRDLLKGFAAAGGGLAAAAAALIGKRTISLAQSAAQKVYLPAVHNPEKITVVCPDNRVVQVYDSRSNRFRGEWTGAGQYPHFWQHVDQTVVNAMTEEGLKSLTGASSLAGAWGALLPQYRAGQKIAIKVSFNNIERFDDMDDDIDAVIEPVNALVRGMVQYGVRPQDIWVYDAIKVIPNRFIQGNLYPGVEFYSRPGYSAPGALTKATSHSAERVHFSPPAGGTPLDSLRLPTVLTEATYLINMPILKGHGGARLSMVLKNHFGSVTDSPQPLHLYCYSNPDTLFAQYWQQYSPYTDLNLNRHIREKTILIVGDALFGSSGSNTVAPARWDIFNNYFPGRLLFSCDPVAVDSIMTDWYTLEHPTIDPRFSHYLLLAEQAGLGTCERKDPRDAASYTRIDLENINLG